MNSHQVEAEAIYIELLYPVEQRVSHKLAKHLVLAGRLTPHSGSILERAVRIHPIVIIRYRSLKSRIIGRVDVIIDNIQCHRNPRIMIGLNHCFQVANSLRRISRIAGKAGLRSMIILRVIAPVVDQLSIFIIVLVTIRDRLKLDDINS